MPRNGSGTYNRVPGSAYTNGTVNDGSELDAEMNDIATALTASLTADGQKPLAANLPAAGYKLTGLGSGSAAADSVSLGQAQAQAYIWLTSVSGTDTIVATATPAISAYAAGQTFRFAPANTNTGAVTINISGVGPLAVTKKGSTALVASDLVAGYIYQITHDGTRFQIDRKIDFATSAETQAGSSTSLAVTPAGLASVTSTETRAGLAELATDAEAQAYTANKFIDGAKLNTALKGANQSLATTGFQNLPGGLLFKWGFINNTAGGYGTTTENFAAAFPNACVHVEVQYFSTPAGNLFPTMVTAKSVSSFEYYGALIGATWFAVGY